MVVLGGSMVYARVRQLEMKDNTPSKTVNRVMMKRYIHLIYQVFSGLIVATIQNIIC